MEINAAFDADVLSPERDCRSSIPHLMLIMPRIRMADTRNRGAKEYEKTRELLLLSSRHKAMVLIALTSASHAVVTSSANQISFSSTNDHQEPCDGPSSVDLAHVSA